MKNWRNTTIPERIAFLAEKAGNATVLARMIGKRQSAIREAMNAKPDGGIRLQTAAAICKAMKCRIEWLATGEGPIFLDDAPESLVDLQGISPRIQLALLAQITRVREGNVEAITEWTMRAAIDHQMKVGPREPIAQQLRHLADVIEAALNITPGANVPVKSTSKLK